MSAPSGPPAKRARTDASGSVPSAAARSGGVASGPPLAGASRPAARARGVMSAPGAFAAGRVIPPGMIRLTDQEMKRYLSRAETEAIRQRVRRRLFSINPFLANPAIVNVYISPRNPSKPDDVNHLQVRLQPEYQDMVVCDEYKGADSARGSGFWIGGWFSNKLESFVIFCILSGGDQVLLPTPRQFQCLWESIRRFLKRHNIGGESYYYTSIARRLNKSPGRHTVNFHLKVRVPTDLITDRMKAYKLIGYKGLRNVLETVNYQNSRPTVSRQEVQATISQDCKECPWACGKLRTDLAKLYGPSAPRPKRGRV